ncbi:MAG: cytidine deaminase [Anaerolineae bacterium]|nr:cytidine deaminase [Anaerolineae bacterium]
MPPSTALIQAAITAAEYAYIPYSHYPVGAALQAADGTIFTGCNVENAAYPATICAERTALVKAVSEGHREFTALAVVTKNGGSPCGTCRQMLYEFAPHLPVIIADLSGKIHYELLLSDLLPHGFGPGSLE